MKKLTYKILLINLAVLVFFSTNSIAASKSQSIPVSCRIPEIPGINAPLIEEASSTMKGEQGMQEERSTEGHHLLQEKRHNLYTFYAR